MTATGSCPWGCRGNTQVGIPAREGTLLACLYYAKSPLLRWLLGHNTGQVCFSAELAAGLVIGLSVAAVGRLKRSALLTLGPGFYRLQMAGCRSEHCPRVLAKMSGIQPRRSFSFESRATAQRPVCCCLPLHVTQAGASVTQLFELRVLSLLAALV